MPEHWRLYQAIRMGVSFESYQQIPPAVMTELLEIHKIAKGRS